jgi:prefoldin subunit 5|tara:strand:+ start:26 stop:262 length:237 start_codon:yes stop_codon:yes gene_type:complete
MAEEKTEKTVVSINGEDYNLEQDFDDKQRYLIAQVQDLQQKRQAAQFQLDQVAIAADSFMQQLLTSLSEKDVEEAEVG